MAAINLLPPDALLNDTFPLAHDHMKDLQRQVNSGTLFPITSEDYAQQLSLDSFSIQFMRDYLPHILQVYGEIRKHCIDFKTDVFPAIVGVASSLYHYSEEVETFYGALYRAVTDFTGANWQNEADVAKFLAMIVSSRTAELMKMHQHGGTVIENLQRFEGDIKADKWAAESSRNELRPILEDQQGRFPRMGMRNYQSTYDAFDRIKLKSDLTINSLDAILRLIQPAVDTIKVLQDSIEDIYNCLNNLINQVNSNNRYALNSFLSSDLTYVKQQWVTLAQRADDYRQKAWVSPTELL